MPEDNALVLDLEGLNEDELVSMKDELDASMASIRMQIDNAKARAVDGNYADRDWWRRANHALRIKGRQSQQIQSALGRLRRLKKLDQQQSLDGRFVKAAKEMLPRPLFESILERAQKGTNEDTKKEA